MKKSLKHIYPLLLGFLLASLAHDFTMIKLYFISGIFMLTFPVYLKKYFWQQD